MSTEFYWVAVALTTILSASRLTRLVVFDKFPPVRRIRDKFLDLTDEGPRRRKWQLLVLCGYCFSFWATLLVVVWGDLTGIYDGHSAFASDLPRQAWWFFNGTLAASYLAAVFMSYDGDNSSSEDD